MHRYTKNDVRKLYDRCVAAGLFPESSTLSIMAPGDGWTRYSVYNTSGLDSSCYFSGARDAYQNLARMLAAYQLGIEHQQRHAARRIA